MPGVPGLARGAARPWSGALREPRAGTAGVPRWAEKRHLQGRPGVRVHVSREARSSPFPKREKLVSGTLEPRTG